MVTSYIETDEVPWSSADILVAADQDPPGLITTIMDCYFNQEFFGRNELKQSDKDRIIAIVGKRKKQVKCSGNKIHQTPGKHSDYYWLCNEGSVEIIAEVTNYNVSFLKSVVKLEENKEFPEFFQYLADVCGTLIVNFNTILENEYIVESLLDTGKICAGIYGSRDYILSSWEQRNHIAYGGENNVVNKALREKDTRADFVLLFCKDANIYAIEKVMFSSFNLQRKYYGLD